MSELKFEVATSRYQARELIIASGFAPIRITRGHPRWKLGYELKGNIQLLAPTKEEFGLTDESAFASAYVGRLQTIDVQEIVAALSEMSIANGCVGLVLLCFEDVATGALCHRRLLAEFLHEELGVVVPELTLAIRPMTTFH